MESSEFNISLAKEFSTRVQLTHFCTQIDKLSPEDARNVAKQLLHLYMQTNVAISELHKYPVDKSIDFVFERIKNLKPLDI